MDIGAKGAAFVPADELSLSKVDRVSSLMQILDHPLGRLCLIQHIVFGARCMQCTGLSCHVRVLLADSQVSDVIAPNQRREFIIVRDNYRDNEIHLSLKQIEVGVGHRSAMQL